MKFIQALCETVTRALGLSAFSPWDQDTLQQPVGPGTRINKINGPEILRGGSHGTPVINTHLGQPTEGLHSLFPHKQGVKSDPFHESEYVYSKFSIPSSTVYYQLLLKGPTFFVMY